MKCAVIEWNNHHDEVVPSLVYGLNRLGIVPDVVLSEDRAIKKNAFSYATDSRVQTLPE